MGTEPSKPSSIADLQEELRHLGDRVVLTLIRKGQVTPPSSRPSKAVASWTMAARLSVINEMKRRLSIEFTPAEGVTATWREAISRQAQQIRDLVTGRRGRYIPLESPKMTKRGASAARRPDSAPKRPQTDAAPPLSAAIAVRANAADPLLIDNT